MGSKQIDTINVTLLRATYKLAKNMMVIHVWDSCFPLWNDWIIRVQLMNMQNLLFFAKKILFGKLPSPVSLHSTTFHEGVNKIFRQFIYN